MKMNDSLGNAAEENVFFFCIIHDVFNGISGLKFCFIKSRNLITNLHFLWENEENALFT